MPLEMLKTDSARTADALSNIDAEAAAIMGSAANSVKTILARREAMDKAGQAGAPLMVIAGEHHAMPAHYLHHMLVLDGLAKSGESLAFGIELEHTLLSQSFFTAVKQKPNPAIAAAIEAQDQNDRLALHCWPAFCGSPTADLARNVIYRYLQRRPDIGVKLTDAAMNDHFLDPQDLSTGASMLDCLGKTGAYVAADKPEGFHVRNHHMTTLLGNLADSRGARIAIQQAGFIHVAGYCAGNYEGGQSLAACFNAQNIKPLAILPVHGGYDPADIPSGHTLREPDIIFSENLPEKTAVRSNEKTGATFITLREEAEWVNAILARTDLTGEQMSTREYREFGTSAQREICEQFVVWEREFYPAARAKEPRPAANAAIQTAVAPARNL